MRNLPNFEFPHRIHTLNDPSSFFVDRKKAEEFIALWSVGLPENTNQQTIELEATFECFLKQLKEVGQDPKNLKVIKLDSLMELQ